MKFNTKDVPPDKGFSLVPDGEYTCCVTTVDVKKTKSGRGEYLAMTIQVIDGQYKNRQWFENWCVKHDHEQTQQIARGKLSALCLACGIEEFEDESELLDRPFKARVGSRPGTDGHPDSNEIKRSIIPKDKRKTKVDKSAFVNKHGDVEAKTNGVETTEVDPRQEKLTFDTDDIPF